MSTTATSTPTLPGCTGRSRPRKTWRWPSGGACGRTFRRGRCGESESTKPRRIGPSAAVMAEVVGQAVSAVPLVKRYSTADLRVFSTEESARFLDRTIADPQRDATLAWELLYRLEPELYERLVLAEHLHPGILKWLPPHVPLTIEVVARCDQLTAVEPAAPLRERLRAKLASVPNTRIISGFFDALPLADQSAELVVACSALTPEPAHGGDRGLAAMERVCAPGGMVVIVWPNHPEWLATHGYRYLSFPGPMTMDFASPTEAVQLATIFYPHAVAEIKARGQRQVPYDVLGVNPPCDLAYRTIP